MARTLQKVAHPCSRLWLCVQYSQKFPLNAGFIFNPDRIAGLSMKNIFQCLHPVERLYEMPQDFHVLQCYKCQTFQVQQVKKVLKWMCKLCGEKQSVIRVYGRGSGADCRKHVQELNRKRGENDEQMVSARRVEEDDLHLNKFQMDAADVESGSKWNKYIEPVLYDDDDDASQTDVVYATDRSQYNAVALQNRKQKRENYKQSKAYNRTNTNNRMTYQKEYFHQGSGSDVTQTDRFQNNVSYIKRIPENCLASKPAKRTKWNDYSSPKDSHQNNSEDDLQLLFENHEVNRITNSQVRRLTNEELNLSPVIKTSKPVKLTNNITKSKSKWDAFVSQSPEQEVEEFNLNENSPNFEFDSELEVGISSENQFSRPDRIIPETSVQNQESPPGSRKSMFNVSDFDDTEFEFVV